MIIFSSLASGRISGRGALNFLGERQIQSHLPESGAEPDVSICVLKPLACRASVSGVQSCNSGSPPVITAIRPG